MHNPAALGPRLGQAGHLCRERMNVRLSRYEVTPAQTHLLLSLQDHGGEMAQCAITEFLKVKPSTANGILDRLEEKEMVSRSVSGNDARRRLITLTGRGREQLELFRRCFEEVEAVMLQGFTPEETETFRTLLNRMICNLEEDRSHDEKAVAPRQALR